MAIDNLIGGSAPNEHRFFSGRLIMGFAPNEPGAFYLQVHIAKSKEALFVYWEVLGLRFDLNNLCLREAAELRKRDLFFFVQLH